MLKSSSLTSGRTLTNQIAGDRWREVQAHAELLEFDRDLSDAVDDGNRKLAASQEARLLAVVSDEIRLREALEIAGLLERSDQRSRVPARVEQEDVQEIAELHLSVERHACARLRSLVTVRLSSLNSDRGNWPSSLVRSNRRRRWLP